MQGLGAKLRESGQALASVFSNPGLRRVQLAFVGSIVGDWAYAIAVAVYAYDRKDARWRNSGPVTTSARSPC